MEETGYKAKNLKLLFKYTRHGTYNCGQDFIFIAKVDRIIKNKTKENVQKKWLNIDKIEEFFEKKIQNCRNYGICAILHLFI